MPYCNSTDCPLLQMPGIQTRGIEPQGSQQPKLYLLGEAPGENEDREGRVFCGNTGQLLHQCLSQISVDYNYLRIGNTIRCAPRKDNERIGKPTKDQKAACRDSVIEDIVRTNPKVIVPMGNHALGAILGVDKIMSIRGNVRSVNLGGRTFTVVPTLHPSAILHAKMDQTLTIFLMKDLAMAWNMAKSGGDLQASVQEDETRDYRLLNSLAEIRDYVEFLVQHCKQDGAFITADFETGSLDWFRPEIPLLLLSICHAPGQARAIPFEHYESPLRGQTAEIGRLLKPLERLPVANQNLPFDYQWFKSRLDIALGNIYGDPLHAHHCIYTSTRPNDLETMAGLYLGEPPWTCHVQEIVAQRKKEIAAKLSEQKKIAKKAKAKKTETEEQYQARVQQASAGIDYWMVWQAAAKMGPGYAVVPLADLTAYGCKDADMTWRLIPYLHQRLREEGLFEVYQEHYLASIPAFAEMQQSGLHIDTQHVAYLEDTIPKKATEIAAFIQSTQYGQAFLAATKKTSLNLASPPQVATLLYDVMKLPACDIKGKKPRTTDADQLEVLAGATKRAGRKTIQKAVERISEYRTLMKNLSSYVKGVESCLDPYQLVHPTWSIPGTDTGRMSCQDPPAHSMPKKGGFREQFDSRWKDIGGCILGVDESQNELRVYASLANDPYLVWFYNYADDPDVHRYLATLLFDKSAETVTSEERSIAKTCVFASLFGGGPRQLAFQTGISYREAQRIHTKFMGILSVAILERYAVEQVRQNGYITTVLGRHRIIDLNAPGGHGERQCLNSLVQSPASDIVKKAADRAHKYMKQAGVKSKLILFHHDALYWDVYPGELFWLVQLAERVMTTEPMEMYKWLRVPMKIGIEFGNSWGDKIAVDTWAENRLIVHYQKEKAEDSVLPRYEKKVQKQFEGPLGISLQLTNVLANDQEVVGIVRPRS